MERVSDSLVGVLAGWSQAFDSNSDRFGSSHQNLMKILLKWKALSWLSFCQISNKNINFQVLWESVKKSKSSFVKPHVDHTPAMQQHVKLCY